MLDPITDHVTKYIAATGNAHYDVQNNVAVVVFHDENEFIPLHDLALSRELGFFRRSQFPNESAIAAYQPYYNVHPLVTPDGWNAYVLVDHRMEFGYLLGEPWEMVEAYHALRRALSGQMGEPIDDQHEALGRGLWLSTSEAAERANRFEPEEWPLGRATYERLRMAARQGRIHAVRTELHGWKFHIHSLDEWLADEDAHKRGVSANGK